MSWAVRGAGTGQTDTAGPRAGALGEGAELSVFTELHAWREGRTAGKPSPLLLPGQVTGMVRSDGGLDLGIRKPWVGVCPLLTSCDLKLIDKYL